MIPEASWLHRLGAGWKLAALLVAGTALLFVGRAPLLFAALVIVAGLYAAAGVAPRRAWAQLRPMLVVLGLVFGAQALIDGWEAGVVAVLRLATLVLLAALVSLTTTASAMTAVVEAALRPLGRLGVRTRPIALALALAVRFLPLLAERAAQVREAQRARGLDRNLLALAVPLIVQGLAMAHALADAIEARGYDPDAE